MTLQEIKRDVKSKIGQTVQTVWGPSLVVGIIKEEDGEYVHLKEFGEEDYTVKLENWPESLM